MIDTGGLFDATSVGDLMAKQARVAIDEADLVVFVVDARDGLTAADLDIAAQLRRAGRSVHLAINKIDGVDADAAAAEFTRLGFASTPISAAHGRGIAALQSAIVAALPVQNPAAPDDSDSRIRVAVIGRPNVGKSTLINRWLGEERQVVFDAPGTTRDAIEIPFDHAAGRFTLIDTAGVRRKGRTEDVVEKFSVVKALDAIDSADVAVIVIDASEGLVEQDLHVLGYAIDRGAGLVIAVNNGTGCRVMRASGFARSSHAVSNSRRGHRCIAFRRCTGPACAAYSRTSHGSTSRGDSTCRPHIWRGS